MRRAKKFHKPSDFALVLIFLHDLELAGRKGPRILLAGLERASNFRAEPARPSFRISLTWSNSGRAFFRHMRRSLSDRPIESVVGAWRCAGDKRGSSFKRSVLPSFWLSHFCPIARRPATEPRAAHVGICEVARGERDATRFGAGDLRRAPTTSGSNNARTIVEITRAG